MRRDALEYIWGDAQSKRDGGESGSLFSYTSLVTLTGPTNISSGRKLALATVYG